MPGARSAPPGHDKEAALAAVDAAIAGLRASAYTAGTVLRVDGGIGELAY